MAPSHATPPTQAAILTPLGQGGIAVLRVVGPRAHEVVRAVFRPKRPIPSRPDPGRIHYGHVLDGEERVDEVLVRLVPRAAAPQGVPTAEVDCHGGVVAVQRVLECLVARGVQAVDGEALVAAQCRTLIEAEARHALLRAATGLAADVLLDQLNGALERTLRALPWDQPEAAATGLETLGATERLGRRLWQPARVVLVGPTNAGKSTLFNALAREDRVIVSPTPGTTRDVVSSEVALGGVPVWLADTAGECAAETSLEREAIARARQAAATADLALVVVDASVERPGQLEALRAALAVPAVTVLNKVDRARAPWAASVRGAVACSAVTGQGVRALARRVVRELVGEAKREPGRAVVFTERQAGLLRSALDALRSGRAEAAEALIRECIGESPGAPPPAEC